MINQKRFIIACLIAYTSFMFWWFLRDDAPASRQTSGQPAPVTATSRPCSSRPVGNSGKGLPAPPTSAPGAAAAGAMRGVNIINNLTSGGSCEEN